MATATPMRIKLENVIGEGAHSQVRLGHDLNTFEPLAVKIVNIKKLGREVFESELEIMRMLPEHRNIPRLLGHFSSTTKAYLVLEYLPFPTLHSFVRTHKPLEGQCAFILRQLIDVVMFMAEHGICHRDLKSENMMINPDTLIIKLIDFSLATEIDSLEDFDDSYRGTPLYMAPEVMVKEGLIYRIIPAEIWSAGIIYWECLIGEHPFAEATSKKELFEMQAKTHELYAGLSAEAKTVLFAILQLDPKRRASLEETKIITQAMFSDARKSSILTPTRPYSTERTKSHARLSVENKVIPQRINNRGEFSELRNTTPSKLQ